MPSVDRAIYRLHRRRVAYQKHRKSIRERWEVPNFNNKHLTFRERRAQSKKFWTRYKRFIKKRAKGYPPKEVVADQSKWIMESNLMKIDSLTNAAFLSLALGRDEIVDIILYMLNTMIEEMYFRYSEVLIDIWANGEGAFNHGQIAITEMYYWGTIFGYITDCQEDWPWVEPYEYVDRVMFAFRQGVWVRAFTDITEEPIPYMRRYQRVAENAYEAYQAIEAVSMITSFIGMFGAPDPKVSMGRGVDGNLVTTQSLWEDSTAPTLMFTD